ncbi:MAG: flagellar FlbD family protein [Phycisphaerales bacterium]
MISVTRLNDQKFILNAEIIRTVEENPDTIITLVSGEHMVVKESMTEVVRRCIEYGRHLRKLSEPG